jgi:5-methyltetrahydropteroyltriglutamate--homocysteine methyltransferase
VRAEVVDLAAAGAREIEIAEPAIAARPAEVSLAAAALAHVTAGLAGRARTWTQVGYGDDAPVAQAVLGLPVDAILIGASRLPAHLPGDKTIVVGVVDAVSPELEGEHVVRERAERALGRIPRERLWLSPDAGLRGLEPDVARRKLATLVAVARAL